jgi:hypothetical protein
VTERTYRGLRSRNIASPCVMLVSIPDETTPNNGAGGGQSYPRASSQGTGAPISYFGYMRFYRFSTHDTPKPDKPHWPGMRTYNLYWEVINSTTGKLKAPKALTKRALPGYPILRSEPDCVHRGWGFNVNLNGRFAMKACTRTALLAAAVALTFLASLAHSAGNRSQQFQHSGRTKTLRAGIL